MSHHYHLSLLPATKAAAAEPVVTVNRDSGIAIATFMHIDGEWWPVLRENVKFDESDGVAVGKVWALLHGNMP